jgi:hypothetical protein
MYEQLILDGVTSDDADHCKGGVRQAWNRLCATDSESRAERSLQTVIYLICRDRSRSAVDWRYATAIICQHIFGACRMPMLGMQTSPTPKRGNRVFHRDFFSYQGVFLTPVHKVRTYMYMYWIGLRWESYRQRASSMSAAKYYVWSRTSAWTDGLFCNLGDHASRLTLHQSSLPPITDHLRPSEVESLVFAARLCTQWSILRSVPFRRCTSNLRAVENPRLERPHSPIGARFYNHRLRQASQRGSQIHVVVQNN